MVLVVQHSLFITAVNLTSDSEKLHHWSTEHAGKGQMSYKLSELQSLTP